MKTNPVMFEALVSAATFGKLAFENGIPATSARDPNLAPLFRGRTPREAMRIMDAWYKAWHRANLDTPAEA